MGRPGVPHGRPPRDGLRPQALPAGATALPAPWQRAARARRRALLLTIALATVLATTVLARAPWGAGLAPLHALQTALFALLFAWVAAGCVTALMGFWVLLRGDPQRLSARTAGDRPLERRCAHRPRHADLQRGRGHRLRRAARHL